MVVPVLWFGAQGLVPNGKEHHNTVLRNECGHTVLYISSLVS